MATAPIATWWRTAKSSPASEVLRGVAFATNNWVFVGLDSGAPKIYTIPAADFGDASPSFISRTPDGSDPLYGVAHVSAENRTIAVGDNGTVETSLDYGATWFRLGLAGSPDFRDIVGVTGSATALFVAVGYGAIWGRDNTGVWTARWAGAQNYFGVAYRSGVGWVAVGAGGNGTHSATAGAGSFLSPYSIDGQTLYSVAGNDSYYLAGGTSGQTFRSATGLSGSWSRRQLDSSSPIGAIAPLAADDQWAALTFAGEIFTSDNNGATWTKADYQIADNVWRMAVGNSMGGAVGAVGGIYYTSALTQADPTPATPPAPPPALVDNDTMADDAVGRLATQFRS